MSFLSKLINEQEVDISSPVKAKPVVGQSKKVAKVETPKKPVTPVKSVVKVRPAPPVPQILQLNVDVWQSLDSITIFAPVPGATMETINISIEGDADTVVIEGLMNNPDESFSFKRGVGQPSAKECVWGEFYRRIVLPQPVDMDNAEANLENGVLTLELPFANPQS